MHSDDPAGPESSRDPRIHHHALAARTVFVAPRRADRPVDEAGADRPTATPPAHACPFCAGNEHLTPPDHLRAASGDGTWRARIIPNRYPIVEPCEGSQPEAARSCDVRPAHGVHDVVIESPDHVRSVLDVDPTGWQDAWHLCRRRLELFADRPDLAWAMVFKNSGPRAGASLEHVHSQLVALDFVPPAVRDELERSAACPGEFDELIHRAEREGRVVETSGRLVAIVPPATRQPFETWIVPRHEEPSFHETSAETVRELAGLTRSFVRRLERVVPGADYNWWLHQAPFAHARPSIPASGGFRWHLEILPRLASFAGFELGAGCHITTMPPAESAALLAKA